ncbi:hypothetical protein MKX01_024594 [Papaver californicum]|nr:hypothetical protein MKX01_024594 [Papaver californicum]
MDNSQSMSYNAGQAMGQAEIKKDQASNAMQSAGQQMKEKAQGAVDAIKDATGMKK